MKPEDILYERLTRLEAGEPLEAVLAGLPEADAELVRMAVSLRVAAQAEPPASVLQRQRLMRVAKENQSMSNPNKPRSGWLWPVALVGGMGTVFACVAVGVLLLGGFLWWRSARTTAQNTDAPSVQATPAPGSGPIVQATASATEVAVVPANPQTGVLADVRGLVEVQAADGQWAKASNGHTVQVSQRVRTGALSTATLKFYDGSQAALDPDTEIAVDVLDAQTTGTRTILLTQVRGNSDHTVAKSTDPASRYEVATPSGTGKAKGTIFHVSVSLIQTVQFIVLEGAVDVINLDVVVIVVAGQSTTIVLGQPPQAPVFRITGEGEVSQIGGVWHIAGYSFLTNSLTEIVGEPRVGDWVAFEAHLLPDGLRFLDRVVLLHRNYENRFTFTGEVESMGDEEWVVAGQTIHVDDVTRIEPDIAVGDTVEVRGGIADDGELWATGIQRVITNGFRFTGVVETLGDEAWVVSGISVAVNVSTTVDADIVVGDRVLVIGQILDDGTWQALSISRIETDTFDFVGVVITTDPWVVSGVLIDTDEQTQIDDDIETGNRVRVRGRVLADGTWLADSIEQLDEGNRHHIQFTAQVESIDPWIIGHTAVDVDERTKISDGIVVGDWVTVKGNLLPDGTVLAKKIKLVNRAQGCLILTTVVRTVDTSQVVLFDGQTINLDQPTFDLEGELNVASVILVYVCVDENGDLQISQIIVVFQLDTVPVIINNNGGDGGDKGDCKEGPGLGLGHCKNKDKDDD